MKINKILSFVFASALLFTVSCNDDDPVIEPPKGAYENGIFVTNEGNFGVPNADVTFVSDNLNSIEQNIYKTNNGEDLGDVLQTMYYNGDYTYLVLNNTNKVTVVNRYTFKKTGEITSNLSNPRYIGFANNFVYVSNDKYGGDKYVSVYKQSDLSFVKKIAMTDAAERLVSAGSNIFVQNASFGFGNKISYINTSTNEVQSEIAVPSGQIQKIVSDNNNVYAIASDFGLVDSYIYQISSTGSITKTTTLTGIENAANLCIDGGKFYFTSGMKIYGMDMNTSAIPSSPIATATQSDAYSGLYGFNVIDGKIFTSDANGFTADSKVTVYDTSGTVIKTFTAGKGTNGFYKN